VKTKNKLVVVALVGVFGGVCAARAEDKVENANGVLKAIEGGDAASADGGQQDQSVQTFTFEVSGLYGAPVSCTITAMLPQGTARKLAFRGEYTCTGPMNVEFDIYEDVSYDNGTNAHYNLTRQYFENRSSGGYTAYERYADDYGPGIVSTSVEAVACDASGACTPWLYAHSTGVHMR
jgi:hypothetical protein